MQAKTGMRKAALGLAGFILSGIGLFYVFYQIDFQKLFESARHIRLSYLLASIALYWGGMVVVRSLLIRQLLNPIGKIRAGKAYRYICIGYLANNVLPLRMGEVIRIGGIARVSGINFVSVAGGLAVERLLDLAMTILVGIAAVQVAPLPQNIRTLVLVIGVGLIGAFSVLAFLARRGINEIPQQGKARTGILIWNLLARFSKGLRILGSFKSMLSALALSAVLWCLTVVVLQLRLAAFDVPATLPIALVLLTSLALGVSLPSAPGYIGVYHVFAAGALTLFGIDEETAVGFAIFCHLVDIIPASLIGALCMILEGLGLADLRRSGRPSEPNN